jgi:peptide chain release factor 2
MSSRLLLAARARAAYALARRPPPPPPLHTTTTTTTTPIARLLLKRPRSLTLMSASQIRAINSSASSSKSVVARASPSSAAADASSTTLGAGSLKRALAEARSRVAEALRVADAPGLRQRLAERELEAEDPQLWEKSGGGGAQALLSEVASLRSRLSALASFEAALEDAAFALELLEAEQHDGKDDDDAAAANAEHAEIVREALEGLSTLARRLDAWELSALLSGPHDRLGAHLTITAGAGGADAMDWAGMLERMYTRWAHARGYKVTIEDRIVGEEAGVKTSELLVEGELAYGWLRGERGTHRLVRSSPFNAKGLRQTSFAGVEVVPLLPESEGGGSGSSASQLEVPERDLQWNFQRSGGKGGQNVNKVESGVRLLHIPTGLAVKSTQERSQQQNRAIALARLKAKLLAALEDQRASELAALRGDAVRASWGQQVRNYVLHPYTLVKDSRGEGWETADAQGVLDGGSGLEGAMAAVLRATAAAGAREANQQ